MQKVHELMHRFNNHNLGILLVRVALGVVFINAGWFKLNNVDMVVGGFASMGIPAFLAYLVMYSEFIGGILLILGVFVRYVGIVLAIIMAVATLKVHFVNGFSLANGGYEYTFVLLLASLAMVTFGSGSYSVAHLFKKKSA